MFVHDDQRIEWELASSKRMQEAEPNEVVI